MPPAGVPAGSNMSAIDGMLNNLDPTALSAIPGIMSGGSQGTGGPQAIPGIPMVYMGSKTVVDVPRGTDNLDFSNPPGKVQKEKLRTLDSLLADFEQADKKERRRMALLLALAGRLGGLRDIKDAKLLANETSLGDVIGAYEELLTEAAEAKARGINLTPDQILKRDIAYMLPNKVSWDGNFDTLMGTLKGAGIDLGESLEDAAADEEEDLDNTTTQTSVSRNFMDPADAKALVRGMLQQELGRDPTAGEFDEFLAAIHSAEAANPSKTTTTQRVVEDPETGDVSVTNRSRTTAGITNAGISDLMLEKARRNPGWAEWQAVGVYGPALMQALGSTVPGR